ncbi:hypothetical protein HYH03_004671 [Edaphochlamys debaryana]|uniref:Uncharacterized protein n=1 Tax=Edaphochlamys debaryana TaxID=47281 RepID=A0A835Y731_9CHLO|nr:hypothetical protein HYH03_004671 [Edaphochlamys debaryana]|eukprot:KAG2497522.1 hypothetical protein HYH03_004671 [Edaphochlamys debaryana]
MRPRPQSSALAPALHAQDNLVQLGWITRLGVEGAAACPAPGSATAGAAGQPPPPLDRSWMLDAGRWGGGY